MSEVPLLFASPTQELVPWLVPTGSGVDRCNCDPHPPNQPPPHSCSILRTAIRTLDIWQCAVISASRYLLFCKSGAGETTGDKLGLRGRRKSPPPARLEGAPSLAPCGNVQMRAPVRLGMSPCTIWTVFPPLSGVRDALLGFVLSKEVVRVGAGPWGIESSVYPNDLYRTSKWEHANKGFGFQEHVLTIFRRVLQRCFIL